MFRAQDVAQPLGCYLPRTEHARDFDHDVGVGQVDGEVGHLGDDEGPKPSGLEVPIELFPLFVPGLARDERQLQVCRDLFELRNVLPAEKDMIVGMAGDQLFCERYFSRVLRSNKKAVPVVGVGIGPLLAQRQWALVSGAKRVGDTAPALQGLSGLESRISYYPTDRMEVDSLAGAYILFDFPVILHEARLIDKHGSLVLAAPMQVLKKRKNRIQFLWCHLINDAVNSVSYLHRAHNAPIDQSIPIAAVFVIGSFAPW